MLTNNDTKLINSLVRKKFRQKYNKFIVEGVKNIQEVISSNVEIDTIYTLKPMFSNANCRIEIISEQELKKISQLVQPNIALALCKIPEEKSINLDGFTLALDDIRDPGNLGTIIRLADWFGIEQIICSEETVDVYNPKVIMATMGSFTRVQLSYGKLEEIFKSYKKPILGTFMDGENIYKKSFPEKAIMVLGNEAKGISTQLLPYFTDKICIPQMGTSHDTESLNVAMATGILLGERASRSFK